MGRGKLSTSGSFSNLVKSDMLAVEALMKAQAQGYHSDIGNALNILLSSGGKRLRPTLTLLIGRLLGAPIKKLTYLGAAVELLHTATLVHDDLIDQSLLRRGSPTLNSQWSAGATVLTGDFLFSCAAHLAAEVDSVPLMKLFSKTLTVIVNGEISQLFSGYCQINRQDYYERIYAKTASLFETSACTPALIEPQSEETIETMRQFGYDIGMAFQIIDDIFDFVSVQDTLGKPVGNDLRQGLVTLPTLYYIENYPEHPVVLHILKEGKCPDDQIILDKFVEDIRMSNVIQLAQQEAVQFIEKALVNLRKFPKSPERVALEDLANYIIQRKL